MFIIIYLLFVEFLLSFSLTRKMVENMCIPYIMILSQDLICYVMFGRTIFDGMFKHFIVFLISIFSDNNIIQDLKPEFNYVLRIIAFWVYIASIKY